MTVKPSRQKVSFHLYALITWSTAILKIEISRKRILIAPLVLVGSLASRQFRLAVQLCDVMNAQFQRNFSQFGCFRTTLPASGWGYHRLLRKMLQLLTMPFCTRSSIILPNQLSHPRLSCHNPNPNLNCKSRIKMPQNGALLVVKLLLQDSTPKNNNNWLNHFV